MSTCRMASKPLLMSETKQADNPLFPIAQIESTNSPYGKILKLDLTRNFTTPAGIGLDTDSRVDVVALGMRNPWRASFDSEGGLFIADVGHHTVEEISYMPADLFDNPPPKPVNFGWTDREGTIETYTLSAGIAGGPKEPDDVDPIFDYLPPGTDIPSSFHNGNDQFTAAGVPIRGTSVIGGYEFNDRYFFAEFESPSGTSPIYSGVFNNNTPTENYNGENLADIVQHNDSFESLVNHDIDTIVSFGTDNASNLYILDYGEGNPWSPNTNTGEIFRVSAPPPSPLVLTVDRASKIVSLDNSSGGILAIDGYRIQSAIGSMNPTTWDSFEDQQVDGNSWREASGGGTANQLAELNPTTAATLEGSSTRAIGAVFSPNFVTLGQETEDLVFTYTTPAGDSLEGSVNYVGRKQHNNLVLVVDPSSGSGKIQNESEIAVDIEGYFVTSAAGSLLDTWNSLEDQNAAGGDWYEANPSTTQLAELKSDGVTTLNQNDSFDLGTLFSSGSDQDLQFQFLLAGEAVGFAGVVEYESILPGGLPGDFNMNGTVDAADYTVWRDKLGTNDPLSNDGGLPGPVGTAHYDLWKLNFGAASSAGAASAVPEPSPVWMLASAHFAIFGYRWRR